MAVFKLSDAGEDEGMMEGEGVKREVKSVNHRSVKMLLMMVLRGVSFGFWSFSHIGTNMSFTVVNNFIHYKYIITTTPISLTIYT